MRIEPLTPTLGARLHGVDLAALDDAAFAELHAAYLQWHVLSIPGQQLSEANYLAFARRLGAPEPHVQVNFHHPAHPEILVLSNELRPDGSPVGLDDGGTYWHSDMAFLQIPSSTTMLYGRVIPDQGGDTLFADMVQAAADLPEDLRAQVDGRIAVNNYGLRPNRRPDDKPMPDARHPVLRRHPETGQPAVFVTPSYTSHIEGLSREESDTALRRLFGHCLQRKYQLRYQWAPNDVVFWDNAAVMHCATVRDLPRDKHRTLWRISLTGEATI